MKEYRRRELAEMARAYLAKGHNTCTVSPAELLELLADSPAEPEIGQLERLKREYERAHPELTGEKKAPPPAATETGRG